MEGIRRILGAGAVSGGDKTERLGSGLSRGATGWRKKAPRVIMEAPRGGAGADAGGRFATRGGWS